MPREPSLAAGVRSKVSGPLRQVGRDSVGRVHAETMQSGRERGVRGSFSRPQAPAEKQLAGLRHCHSSGAVWELCESRGGRPGLSVLTSLLVSVDVKLY